MFQLRGKKLSAVRERKKNKIYRISRTKGDPQENSEDCVSSGVKKNDRSIKVDNVDKFEIKKVFKKRYKKKRHVSGHERGPTEGVPFLGAKEFSVQRKRF